MADTTVLPDPSPGWTTVQGVCDRYEISRPTLYKWIDLGCPTHQPAGPGSHRLFDLAEVDRWIRSADPYAELPPPADAGDRQRFVRSATSIGARVRHVLYGEGTIRRHVPSDAVLVQFDDGGFVASFGTGRITPDGAIR